MNPRRALTVARGTVATAAVAVHDAYEASPLAVHTLAHKIIWAHYARAEAAARADPEYAEIQARRENDPRTSLFGVKGAIHDERQDSIRDRLTPDPLWWPLALRLRDRPFRPLTRGALYAYQRATRGWSDDDTWELGTYVCRTLGAQLTHLANTSSGWPGREDNGGEKVYPEHEDWTAALRKAGAGLEGWATHWGSPAAIALEAAVHEPDDVYRIASDLRSVEDAVRLAAAQEALRWVGENLNDLRN